MCNLADLTGSSLRLASGHRSSVYHSSFWHGLVGQNAVVAVLQQLKLALRRCNHISRHLLYDARFCAQRRSFSRPQSMLGACGRCE